MASFLAVLLFFFSIFCALHSTLSMQSSQVEVLQQIRKQLEYPNQLDSWNYASDLCNLLSSPFVTVSCEEDSVTELKIIGDKPPKIDDFGGYSLPDHTLSDSFSIDSFITTLSRLNNLKVLILVSLGIWGPLPDKIHRLDSLQLLDLSSNFLYGTIPPKISVMGKLHTLALDSNFFNGTVPGWLDSLSNLTILSLKNNKLSGPLPGSIARVSSLSTLSLARNNISGGLPDLSGMINLEVLDIRENRLDSEIPPLPRGTITVLLSRNLITGEISPQIGDLKQLQHLDLSNNLLKGTVPPPIFSLPKLSYLSLASNMLSGSLARELSCGVQLGFVDISTNRFMGSLPKCLIENSNKRVVVFSGNCLSDDPVHQHEPRFCEVRQRKSMWKYVGLLVCIIGGASMLTSALLLAIFCLCRSYLRGIRSKKETRLLDNSSSIGLSSELLTVNRHDSKAGKIGTLALPAYRVFSLEELKRATQDFSSSSLIGEGCHGKVYRGRLENGSEVAVRCLALFKRYSIRNLNLRLDLLSKLRNPNLVYLMGHCVDNSIDDSSANRVFLIYEYMPNGSLLAHLSEKRAGKSLTWQERLGVLIGIAKATHFLNTGILPGFFNNKLKSHNVLLDEHFIAKISDYGLSIITEEIDKHELKTESIKASQAAQIKLQSLEMRRLDDDVYSLGLIILETLAGPLHSRHEEFFFVNEMKVLFGKQEGWKKMIDPVVISHAAEESLSLVISMMEKCLSLESSLRPSVEDVLWNLQYAAQVQATADRERRSNA